LIVLSLFIASLTPPPPPHTLFLSCKALDLFYHQLYIKENHHHQLHTRPTGSRESSLETKGPYVPEAALLVIINNIMRQAIVGGMVSLEHISLEQNCNMTIFAPVHFFHIKCRVLQISIPSAPFTFPL
jgi:hypothetical protein